MTRTGEGSPAAQAKAQRGHQKNDVLVGA